MDVFVRQGDSLWQYSQLFNINLQLINDSNRDIQPDQLSVGQRVRIPSFVAQEYQLQNGDTLWAIAQNRHLTLDALYLVNPTFNPNNLQVGQIIKVPLRITWRLIQSRDHYDHTHLMTDIRRLEGVYPFLQVTSIGNTVLEKEIPEVVIGTGEKKVHYNGSFHANEWITTPVIMTFLNDYVLSLTNNNVLHGVTTPHLYQQSTLSIVPMVNPDGVDLVLNGPPSNETWSTRVIEFNKGSKDYSGWKANIRGVDLNDQFPAKWEAERARNPRVPGPRDFGGEKPLSEPEAISMAELTRRRDFARVIAFHTQCEEIYWGFENSEPPESEVLVNEFSRVSGYLPVKTIESYAGYKDWFIQDWKRPGFTIELGHGINPLPLSQFDEIYQKTLGIFLAGLYM
jgi:g-D-glutamyl-meso-diaminopimelate peptidase